MPLNTSEKKVGIIGGLGPAASADFLNLVVKSFQKVGARMDSDFPRIFLDSISFPDSTEFGCGDVETVVSLVRESVKRMSAFGAKIIVVLCNTIHLYIRSVFEDSEIQHIDIVDIAVNEIIRSGHSKVLILSSEESKKNQLHRHGLTHGMVECIDLDENEQVKLNHVIYQVMGGEIYEASVSLQSLIDRYEELVDAILLGCTELPLANVVSRKAKIINPNVLVADKLVELCGHSKS